MKYVMSLMLTLVMFGSAAAETIFTTPVSLAVLLSDTGNGIQSGDKIAFNFHNFSQITTYLNLDPNDITVTPIVGGPGDSEYGIRFSLAAFIQGANKIYDLGFDFQLRREDGARLIHDNTLAITGGRFGEASVLVAEVVTDAADDSFLANEFAFLTPTDNRPIHHEDFTHLAAVVDVRKDLLLITGNDPNAIAFVSHFDQTFSQLPEPGSIVLSAMSGLGMLGMALVRRRRALKK